MRHQLLAKDSPVEFEHSRGDSTATARTEMLVVVSSNHRSYSGCPVNGLAIFRSVILDCVPGLYLDCKKDTSWYIS